MADQATGLLALGMSLLFLILAFGLRALLHRRATGSTGFQGISASPGSPEWFAGALFILAVLTGVVAPTAQALGWIAPVRGLTGTTAQILGGLLAVSGIAATVLAQHAMGTSWRVGVDPTETTSLVTTGPFTLVRNPIFTTMITTATGLTLLAPNLLAIIALATLVLAVQLQVRVVEEPYLRRAHGPKLHPLREPGRPIPSPNRPGPNDGPPTVIASQIRAV